MYQSKAVRTGKRKQSSSHLKSPKKQEIKLLKCMRLNNKHIIPEIIVLTFIIKVYTNENKHGRICL